MSNQKPFRPLLAATIESDTDLDKLVYPIIASPKVDGIRVICHPELGPVTRSSKPVPNRSLREFLHRPEFAGFDGEVVCGPANAPDVFNRTTSAVMTHDGDQENLMYWVFDDLSDPNGYDSRLYTMAERWYKLSSGWKIFVKMLPFKHIYQPDKLLEAEKEWVEKGFEGIMLRTIQGRYKQGRSTLKEQILLKLKRFKDAEAVVIGFEPLYSNQNPQTRNLQGLAERSDHKAGHVEVQTLGSLRVRHESQFGEFNVGSGFDASQRQFIWDSRDQLLGKTITFKYQEVGVVDKPRFPIFKGFRGAE